MGEVNVPHIEAGALPGEAAGAKGGETSLVGKFRQGIGLVHELGKLGAAKEFPDGGNDGADVDQGLRSGLFRVRLGHALFDHALHAEETYSHLILHELADATDPAIAQVVDVVGAAYAVVELDDSADHGGEVSEVEHPIVRGVGEVETNR